MGRVDIRVDSELHSHHSLPHHSSHSSGGTSGFPPPPPPPPPPPQQHMHQPPSSNSHSCAFLPTPPPPPPPPPQVVGGTVGAGGGSSSGDNFESQFSRVLQKVYQTIERNEIRVMEQDKRDVIKVEWQQVALITDRVLLFCFVTATVTITGVVLFQSPDHSMA